MRVLWALLCQRLDVSQFTGEWTIRREFIQAECAPFPCRPNPFFLVARLVSDNLEDHSGNCEIVLNDPLGHRMAIVEMPVNMQKGTARLSYQVLEQTFPTPGVYTFRILTDDDTHTLSLRLQEPG
jgi:hypothetical protein